MLVAWLTSAWSSLPLLVASLKATSLREHKIMVLACAAMVLQAIRRVDMRSPPAPHNLMPGVGAPMGGGESKRRGSAIVVVANWEVAELLYSARNKPEISHAGVERITKTGKTVQHWELDQEHEPLYARELQVGASLLVACSALSTTEKVHHSKLHWKQNRLVTSNVRVAGLSNISITALGCFWRKFRD